MTEALQIKAGRAQARVLLVDDHALVRQNLSGLIAEEPDLAVCGEAEDAATALALIRELQPDLVILDLSLKRSSGLDLLKDLARLPARPAVLVLSMHEEAVYAERALEAGALGYITKQDATIHILPAIRQVLGGQVYLSSRMAEQMRHTLTSARWVEKREERA